MADNEPWDIPNPCHFVPCKKETCGPCDAGNIFQYPIKPAGVPAGRVVVPLVRVNGQVQDLNAGGYIGSQFVEPPNMCWDAGNGILNIGGRYLKLRTGNMILSDCHGNTIDPCSHIMTCSNFAEIISSSTGIVFKDPTNPFAGLVLELAPDSGLILDEGGLRIDYSKLNYDLICQALKDMECVSEPAPDPDPDPDPGSQNIIRTGIPGYACHTAGDTELQYPIGSYSLTWIPDGVGAGNVIVSPAGPTRFYRGASNSPTFLSDIGSSISQSTFLDITMVSSANACAEPEPDPDPGDPGDPDPTPPPAYDTSPKTLTTQSACGYAGGSLPVKYDNGVLRRASAGTWSTTSQATANWTVNLHNLYGGIIASFTTDLSYGGQMPPGLSRVYNPVNDFDKIMNISPFQYDSLAYITVTNCWLATP